MSDVVSVGIGVIAANIAFLVIYIAYILPETEACVQKRKADVKSKLSTTVGEEYKGKSVEGLIADVFGSIVNHYRETRQIDRWQKIYDQIKNYILSSLLLSLVAVFIPILFSETKIISDFYFSEAFLLGAVLYFILSVYAALKHRGELHKWKVSKERQLTSNSQKTSAF